MPTLRTSTVNIRYGIPAEIGTAWRCLQQKNPALQSPYFAPDFTAIIAGARNNVELAVLEDGKVIAGCFPFERRRWNFAGPVGSFISDYHGVISAPDLRFDPQALLRACGLVAWDFDHVPTAQVSLEPFHRELHRSPIIDLTAGYEAYVGERRAAGTEQIKKNGNLLRRLEREVGPLQFIIHSPDRALLEKLLAWKTDQFRRNRWRDLFSIPWVRQTMEGIHATQTPDFAGMLSALYAGGQLVAAHFGMRSATVWHYWFPAYDPAFANYSPGVMLLLKMAEAAASMGIRTIDLGCGEHSYKYRLMNGYVPTASGSVERPGPATFVRHLWTPIRKLPFKARCWINQTPVGTLARRIRDGAPRNNPDA